METLPRKERGPGAVSMGIATITRKVGLSVVVPCFDEETGLHELHRRLTAACRAEMADDYEIVLVNDGSKDGTWSAMQGIASDDRNVVALRLSRNYGHQLALTAVVYGQRVKREGETWIKRASAWAFYRVLDRMVDVSIAPDTGDFRLMSRRAVDVLNSMPERHRFIRGMVSWIGLKQVPLQYERKSRYAGQTKYPLRKMISLAVDAVTSFSTVPLRFASHLGMILGVAALLYLAYVIFEWTQGAVVEGWTSVISIVLIIGSIQLFVMGIMGAYLGRIFMETKQRPMFVIADIVASDRPDPASVPNEKTRKKIPAAE